MVIDFDINILEVLNMDPENKLLKIKFLMVNTWQDKRMNFYNLQKNPENTQLAAPEWEKIWIPDIAFYNTEEEDTTEAMSNYYHSKMWLSMLLEETLPDNKSELIQNFGYKGQHVNISKLNTYAISFICDFNWEYYPFDTQIRPMKLAVSTSTAYLPDFNMAVNFSAGPYLTYEISIHSSGSVITGHVKVVQISLKFVQNIVPILLNTYLPTLILTIINQLSNYFIVPEMFEAVITINATILMTLASLFISVFDSLPNTVYIKYIHIWMLVTFVYPFIIILIHTCTHVLSKKGEMNKIKMVNYLLMFKGLAYLFYSQRFV